MSSEESVPDFVDISLRAYSRRPPASVLEVISFPLMSERSGVSRYDWEQGSFVIPGEDWGPFKDEIHSAYVLHQSTLAEAARVLWPGLREASHRDGFTKHWNEVLLSDREAILATAMQSRDYRRHSVVLAAHFDEIAAILIPNRTPGAPLLRPVLEHFFPEGGQPRRIENASFSLALIDEERRVDWDVPSNSRACTRAREHPVGASLFAALARVKWRANTGGEIFGGDDLARETGRGAERKLSYGAGLR